MLTAILERDGQQKKVRVSSVTDAYTMASFVQARVVSVIPESPDSPDGQILVMMLASGLTKQ